MKKTRILLIFGLFLLFCGVFTTCENEVMGDWWGPEGPGGTVGTVGTVSDTYTVTFVTNSSLNIPSQQVRAGSLIFEPTPTRDGYTFAGWYIDKELIYKFDFRHPISTENLTLYAKWLENNIFYTVTFDTNGGTPLVSQQNILAGAFIEEPPPISKSASSGQLGFGGWFTFEGRLWDFYFDPMPEQNITLYAIWNDSYHTVTFNSMGGPNVDPQHIATGALITEPKPTRPNYILAGWFTDSSFVYRFDFRLPISNQDLTLFAKWEEIKTCEVTLVANGGTLISVSSPITVIEGNTIERPLITQTGRGFAGWYTEPGFVNLWNFNTPVTSDMLLYAKWDDPHYTVKFNLKLPTALPAGSYTINDAPQDQNIYLNGRIIEPLTDPSITITSPGVTGWSFMGWYYYDTYVDPDNQTAVNNNRNNLKEWDFNRSVTSALPMKEDYPNPPIFTLYARWVENVEHMVWVRKGSFTMGKGTGSTTRAHTVEITEGFFISKYEVTQTLYSDVLVWAIGKGLVAASQINTTPSNFTGGGGAGAINAGYPVERVSWYDAVFFSNLYTLYINEKESRMLNQVYNIANISRAPDSGFPTTTRPRAITAASVTPNWNNNGYRLPTEAEWEYAARGGYRPSADYLYAGSNTVIEVAVYNDTPGKGASGTLGVSSYAPNALGIFDMSGNVYEWCWDWYSSSYYTVTPYPHVNPRGPTSGTERVRRGGCWNNVPANVEVAAREKADPANANWVIGFRLARGAAVIF